MSLHIARLGDHEPATEALDGLDDHLTLYTDTDWQPTRIEFAGKGIETSTGVTRVETDAGEAYCKPIGNRQGEQVLACE